jgi:hypothetical protein
VPLCTTVDLRRRVCIQSAAQLEHFERDKHACTPARPHALSCFIRHRRARPRRVCGASLCTTVHLPLCACIQSAAQSLGYLAREQLGCTPTRAHPLFHSPPTAEHAALACRVCALPLCAPQCMFYHANAFNQPLNHWDISRVTSLHVRPPRARRSSSSPPLSLSFTCHRRPRTCCPCPSRECCASICTAALLGGDCIQSAVQLGYFESHGPICTSTPCIAPPPWPLSLSLAADGCSCRPRPPRVCGASMGMTGHLPPHVFIQSATQSFEYLARDNHGGMRALRYSSSAGPHALSFLHSPLTATHMPLPVGEPCFYMHHR